MCDDKKKPIADIEPQIRRIVATSNGTLIIDAPVTTTRDAKTISAGSPKRSSDNARPIIYVKGDTGDATNKSWILYSVL